jgi:hypothetical protein
MDIKQNFRNHFFFYTLATLIFVVGVFSYHRFIIRQDYVVGYEGVCDPVINTNKCFAGCDDDACTEKYYYSKMVKYAPDLYKECGEDITDCESANSCLPGDRDCSVIYCNPEAEGDTCATETDTQNNNDGTEEESLQEESPQNNEINNTNL